MNPDHYIDTIKMTLSISSFVRSIDMLKRRTYANSGFIRIRLRLINDDFVELVEFFKVINDQIETIDIPANATGLDRDEKGQIKFSFVNLMAFHRPLVIVDEAHKAGTHLSFDMLAALRPSCIVEFTATPNTDPQNGSNVLFRASAAEVKAAQMIKLPIILTEHPDWRAAVHDAIETRARLAETAKSDPRN
jgi:type III restriction enzyme